jgi:regulator of sigma E protease
MLERLINIGSVVIGLGFVIFIHELGHFLVAKWNGVKVEAFALGFGPVLMSFRKGIGPRFGSSWGAFQKKVETALAAGEDPDRLGLGETEYSIRAVPLGGFVKMLGEGEEGGTADEVKTADPRAYSNKSVGSRMAIISAGVIMNVILGLVAFAVVYGRGGLPVTPAKIGGVVAGLPAYVAGVRPGDEILTVNGQGDLDYGTLQRLTAMSGPREVLHLTLRRPGVPEPIAIDVEPRLEGNAETKRMGILPTFDTELAAILTPAGASATSPAAAAFQPGDRVTAIGPDGETPTPVSDQNTLMEKLSRLRDRPLNITVVRDPEPGSGTGTTAAPETITAVLPPVPAVDFGFRLKMGPIVAVRAGSPAAGADLRAGDRIVGVDGLDPLDPMALPSFFDGKAGQEVTLSIARSEGGKPEVTIPKTLTPSWAPLDVEPVVESEPLDIPALGLAVAVDPTIEAVAPGSPAEAAGLKPGTRLTAVTLRQPAYLKQPERDLIFNLEDGQATWPAVESTIQDLPRHAVLLGIAGRESPVSLTPEPVAGRYNALRGLQFSTLVRPLPPMGLGPALRRGVAETYEAVTSVFATFRGLISREISAKAIGGPIMIADIASRSARAGWITFLQFLGILSLNLAVINFLPVPPLDGGQMVFLIAEKIRGRPLPDKAIAAGSIFGLVLVLGLMAFVMFQDFTRYF